MEQSSYVLLKSLGIHTTQDCDFISFDHQIPSRWLVSNSQREVFWKQYSRLITEHKGYIAEPLRGAVPFVLKFPLVFDKQLTFQDQDKIDHVIQRIACEFQEAISQYFLISDPYFDLAAVILASNSFSGVWLVQVKIQIPGVKANIEEQEHIRDFFLSLLRCRKYESLLPESYTGDLIEDLNFPLNNRYLFLYKGVYDPREPSNASSQRIVNILAFSNTITPLSLEQVFNPNNHHDITSRYMKPIQVDQDFSHWLPLYLSTRYGGKSVRLIPNENDRVLSSNCETDIELLSILIDLVNPNRFRNYDDWLAIGEAIRVCYNGSNEGLHV